MKTLKLSVLFILVIFRMSSTAQYDSIFAVVSGDNVTLWETGAYRNCGSLYRMEINQVNNQLNWYQLDTGASALCYCIFDLAVTYGPLQPGNYNVNIYFTDSYFPLDTIYEGTTNFIIGSGIREVNSGIISQYQSDCNTGQGLFEHQDSEKTNFKIYPVPVRNGDIFHLETFPIGANSVLEIYTITGKLIYSKQYDVDLPIHDQWMKNELFPVSGLYFVRLRTSDQVYVRKINVL